MKNEEIVLKPTESNGPPILLISICLINLTYLGYMLIGSIILASYIGSKSFVYFSILMLTIGFISNIGLLSMKKWALYAYTITCILNLIATFSNGSTNYIQIIICIIVLIVIWKYEDKMLENNTNSKELDAQLKAIRQKQNTFENKLIIPLEKTTISIKQCNVNNAEEIKKDFIASNIESQNSIKENKFLKSYKLVIPTLCIWSFINTYALLQNIETKKAGVIGLDYGLKVFSPLEKFYPFTSHLYYLHSTNNTPYPKTAFGYFNLNFYDYTEYFVYVGGVWMIYFLYRYLKESKLVS